MNLVRISNRVEIAFWNIVISLGTSSVLKNRQIALCAVLVCLATAGLFGFSLTVRTPAFRSGYPEQALLAAADSGPMQKPVTGQQNILIILVDRLSRPQPALDGVWLVAHVPGKERLTFIPVYPLSLGDDEAQPGRFSGLQEVFSLDSSGAPSADFQQVIRKSDLWWDRYLVLDRASLAEVIELVGGIDLGQGRLSGAEVASLLATVAPDPRAAAGLQALIVRQFCQAGRDLFQKVDAGILAGLILDGARSDLDNEDFQQGWRTLQDSQGGLTCELPGQ